MGLSEGHDCPSNREFNKVKLYTLVYNKQTAECFSLPPAKNKEGHPDYPQIPFTYQGKSLNDHLSGVVDGIPYFLHLRQKAEGTTGRRAGSRGFGRERNGDCNGGAVACQIPQSQVS